MTFRARPSTSRSRTWSERDRRSMLLNIGFGLTVIIALLLLALAFGVSWYNDHLAAAATVNGDTITKDAYNRQLAVNDFRTSYMESRLRFLLTTGHLRASDVEARQAAIQSRTSNASSIALEQLIDGKVMADLAPSQDVTVSDADVDAALTDEATTPELRHAWVIAVTPQIASGESALSDADTAAAKATAEQALSDLRSGADWATVAKSVSTDASKDQGGDLGFIDKDSSLDPAFSDALMAAAQDTPTDVIEGADGTFRIGRVSEIIAPSVDQTFDSQLSDAGISMDDFRAALGRDVLRQRLNDAIVAQATAVAPRRKVAEIWMQEDASETKDGAVRTRHILYSPNNDPNNASTVAADDPAWADAKAKAEATYEKLKADPSQFDAIARAESDETSASTTGGKLPYFAPNDPIDPAFAAAIFAPNLQPGQLLAPIRSSFGWHVIQIMHFPTDLEWANHLKQQVDAGTLTFADAARDNSDRASAAEGGDLGWVSEFQLQIQDTPEVAQAIFSAPVGTVGEPLKIDGDGVYLFLVSDQADRAPDPADEATLKSTAFSSWYSQQKAGYDITRDPSLSTATG
jgi:parvulin-like peptidyl-prolyl isomerase